MANEITEPASRERLTLIASPLHLVGVLAVIALLAFSGAAGSADLSKGDAASRPVLYVFNIVGELILLGWSSRASENAARP